MRWALVIVGATLLGACNAVLGANEPTIEKPEPVDGDVSSGSKGEDGGVGGEGGNGRAQAVCGDGVIQDGEECDDQSDGCHQCVLCGTAPEFVDSTHRICYRLGGDEGKKVWADAQKECESWGGNLAVLTSTDEYAFVQNHIHSATWIGAQKDGRNIDWVTGEAFEFAPWAPEQPAGEGCLEITADVGGFALHDCLEEQRYLCERVPGSK